MADPNLQNFSLNFTTPRRSPLWRRRQNNQQNHIMNETIQLFILALFALPTVFAIFAIWKGVSE